MTIRYGALPEEWDQWMELGLTTELLPLVSNPHAKISDQSTMAKVGKTPSIYNAQRNAAGITKWTSIVATPEMIANWRQEPDYGICLQTTRTVKAFDIDIKDPVISAKVVDLINGIAGVMLPMRSRPDSGKCLLLFASDEVDLMKHTIHTDHGVIELLARGNQCVIAGQHEDGRRYRWDGLEDGVLPLTKDQRITIWTTIALVYSNGKETGHERHAPTGTVSSTPVHDPVAEYLMSHHLATSEDAGKVYVPCPWRERHGKKGDMTQTVWLKAGTGGYETGRFQCLDAECAAETNQTFQDKIGFTLDGFPNEEAPIVVKEYRVVYPFTDDPAPVLESLGVTPGANLIGELPAVRKPALERVDTTFQAKAISRNFEEILCFPNITGVTFKYNLFTGRVDFIPYHKPEDTRPMTDYDEIELQFLLCRHPDTRFSEISPDVLKRAIKNHAWKHRYDPVIEWLTALKRTWDGTPRVKTFYSRYLGVDPLNPRAAADSLYLWTALAGRVLEPGCQADMVPIWKSPQGTGKSRMVKALAPHPSMYGELNLNKYDDAETWRKIQGKVVLEINELRGLKTREAEDIKAFITSTHEEYRNLWHEHQDQRPRRCVFIGTTNEHEFLTDTTGNRRFLPIEVGHKQDVAGVSQDRDQLWAEAAFIFEQFGILWQESEVLAAPEHEAFRVTNESYETALWDYLSGPYLQSDTRVLPLTVSLLLRNALNFEVGQQTKSQQIQIGAAMLALGFRRDRVFYKGRQLWAYSRPGDQKYPRFAHVDHSNSEDGLGKI